MIIDLRKNLLQPMVVFSRIDAKDTGYDDGRDLYAAMNVRGTWRKMDGRAVDDSGSYAPANAYKVHVPDSGEFSDYSDFVTVNASGFRDGFKMPYEVEDYFTFSDHMTDERARFICRDGYTLSTGDYVALGAFALKDYVLFADGFVLPYEVMDGFAITEGHGTDATPQPISRINAPEQVRKAVRKHGGFEVSEWRDLRRNGSIKAAGIPGIFANCIYMEG